MNYQYYSTDTPKLNELVLVHFIEINDSFFSAKLIEYSYNGIMTYQDATKKKKVISWNKFVQLNKNMVAKIIDINEKDKIVQLSLIYLDEDYNKNLNAMQIQIKLLDHFNENKYLEKFIKSLSILNNYDYIYLWKSLAYDIDINRRIYNEINNKNISLWKYFNENIENINISNDIKDAVISLYNKKNDIIFNKITSKIGLISINGINILKETLKNILKNIKYKYIFKYDASPYYIFQTLSEDTTINDHNEFIDILEKYIKHHNLLIYIKIDYIGK